MLCFVACAFGHADVDAIYEVMKRVLNSMGVTAQRVDRINHNKKIDQKIIELINNCDLAIADLTYARQSVYYEAGRVHGRNRQVVFTCRKDHFKGTTDDRRIHFDVSTENVIDWTSPSQQFESRLKTRLRPIVAFLLKEKKDQARLKAEEVSHKQLSLEEKKQFLQTNISLFLKKKGFKRGPTSFLSGFNKDTVVICMITPAISGKGITFLRDPFVYLGFDKLRTVVNFTKAIVLVCPIKKISTSTIQHALPEYSQRNPEYKAFSKETSDGDITYAFLDNVKSLTDLNQRLSVFLTKS
jgi:hypothetical protein